MKKFIQRNSIQSKSQSKKTNKEIKKAIDNIKDNTNNNLNNYINMNNKNNRQNNLFEQQNEIMFKNFQRKNQSHFLPPKYNSDHFYRNLNINTYQGKNDKVNLNLINNNNLISNSPIEIAAY